ncbi:MAG: PhoH family protein [Alphaproteobacteria bacterium]|nr:PhoH family protein [Alphaproteobacteria bacterium]
MPTPRDDRAAAREASEGNGVGQVLEFRDNALLAALFGEHDRHLAQIERQLDVVLVSRGNRLVVSGEAWAKKTAARTLLDLYGRLQSGQPVTPGDVDGAIRLAQGGVATAGAVSFVRTRKRDIAPRSANQALYIRELEQSDLVFGLGPAGTGKTYLAVAVGVAKLLSGECDRIILSRPAVEAGERLGFLPGDIRAKIDPYLRPLYDALYDMLPADQVVKRLETGEIEVAPLAFMRGRTLANAFVILDEAQNTTPMQMKMLLTRIGENSRLVVTGDLTQIDLPTGAMSGLRQAVSILTGVSGISFVHFTDVDVVRHPMVTRILQAYDANDRRIHKQRSAADDAER